MRRRRFFASPPVGGFAQNDRYLCFKEEGVVGRCASNHSLFSLTPKTLVILSEAKNLK